MAALANALAHLVVELGRERAAADAGGVGLDDAQHEAGRIGPQPAACRGRAADRVRAGDEGIGAVVDVEQDALRAFEQDFRARLADLLQPLPHRLRIFEHEGRDLAQFGEQLLAVDRLLFEPRAQRVVMRAQPVELRFEMVEMRQIAHADRAAADLVLVSRTDAAPGGADLARSGGRFAQPVEIAVDRQDQRAIVRHREVVVIDGDALRFELLDLGLERPRVEHHAIADHAERARHDPAGQQRELVGGPVDDQRMAGIVPALEAHHGIGAAGQPVDDLALALIAPLGADHGDVGHSIVLANVRKSNAAGVRLI